MYGERSIPERAIEEEEPKIEVTGVSLPDTLGLCDCPYIANTIIAEVESF